MLSYPDIDPVAVAIGPVKVHWYGLMYLVGFASAWWLGHRRARRPGSPWSTQAFDDLLFYVVLGVVVGGRLGYVLFYDLGRLLAEPLSLLYVWQGGMSFHGGLIGVLLAMWLYGRRHNRGFFQVADFVAPLVPLGLGAGRIGNFINGELWGKATGLPWGMQLPCWRFPEACRELSPAAPYSLPLHPNQLYEATLEGLVLFVLLWFYSARPRPAMAVSGLFLIGYGLFRFAIEFVRVPDAQLGYLAFGWVTMGQLLTLPMLIGGGVLFALAHRKNKATV